MPKNPRSPKYLREFVLSQCLGCEQKIEVHSREWTKNELGPMPGFADARMKEYAPAAAAHYKQIRKTVCDLVEQKKVMIPREGFVCAIIEPQED